MHGIIVVTILTLIIKRNTLIFNSTLCSKQPKKSIRSQLLLYMRNGDNSSTTPIIPFSSSFSDVSDTPYSQLRMIYIMLE